MKNSNLKVLSILLIIVFIILFNNNVFAKYIPKTSSFLIIETNLDRTAPKLSVTYSTTAATNGDVVVTIKANEKIQSVSGWILSSDKLTLTKTYSANTTTSMSIYDLAGNKSTVNINITNIDKTAPKLTTTYSITTATNGNVVVTINANEKIQSVSGWTLSNDKLTLTKTYSSNTTTSISVYDLVGNKSTANISITNIDKTAPVVAVSAISNSNTGYTSYANNSKEINLTVKITDNVAIKSVELSKITISVGSSTANLTKAWSKTSTATKEVIYNLKLTNINGNGTLKIAFGQGFVIDTASNNNVKTDVDLKITIDNTKPTITYSQQVITDGKVKAILTANEKVRQLNGWNISSDSKQLNKEFVSNVSYELSVTDLAGNSNTVTVSVTGATYINLTYASHNSEIGWSYGHGNYDIAGKASVLTNPIYKTEALAFNVSGNIASDFVRGRAYVYNYWGNDAICADSGMRYNYGYNPSSSTWKSMASSDLVTISGKRYFQFGGAGVNGAGKTDINGNNPIPVEVAPQFKHGMCGITLSLKDYTDYSIVYQIYVSEVGWVEAKANGDEAIYSKTKPMSAFRVALIPTSEKQSQINTWNKDIGKKIQ